MEHQGIDLEPQSIQRSAVQLEVGLANGQVRPGRVVGAAQADLLRHKSVVPTKAHAAELDDDSPRAQFGHQPGLEKARQSDAIQIEQASQEQENQGKKTDAAPAEVASKSLPGTLRDARRHIMESRRPWP